MIGAVIHVAHGRVLATRASGDDVERSAAHAQGECGMSATEQNKSFVRRFLEEVIVGGNMALLDQLFAADFHWHGNSFGDVQGLDNFKQVLNPFLSAFSDLGIEIEDMVAEGDRVVCRFTARATHSGNFMGLPPTGKTAVWAGNPSYRLAGGMIVEEWFFEDHLGLFQQLGVIPPFGQA
jgi:steroid delta-isomerase-like uncharacterized protein